MIYGIVLGLHVLVCVILVLIVLLQSSKGTGLASGAFGGGADSTVFGGRGAATVLSKATTIFGATFMVTSLTLTLLGASRERAARSVVAEEAAQQAPLQAPSSTAPPGETAPGGTTIPLPGTVPPPNAPPGGAPAPAPDAGTTSAPPADDAAGGTP